MKSTILAVMSVGFLAAGLLAQTLPDTVDAHVAAARAAAGSEHVSTFNNLCTAADERASSNPTAAAAGAPAPAPDRATWHVEPVKVFDNLYYLGQSEYSAWAVTGMRPTPARRIISATR